MNEWWLAGLLVGITLLASAFIVYPLRRHWMNSLLIPAVFLAAFGGYYYWGSFSIWQEYVHDSQRKIQAETLLKSIKTPQELIEKLRAKLDDTPKSAKGWYLLGRLYASQGVWQEAVNAFAKATNFDPGNEQYITNYAHSLWQLHNRQFTPQITDLLSNLLKKNPSQPDALAMLAMDAFAREAYEEAIGYWQRLLRLTPPQSNEAETIRRAIVKAEERIKYKQL